VKTTVREDRLLVVSDIHMGNRLHRTRRAFMEFVQFAVTNEYSICVNGDGVDIAQLSLAHLNDDLTPSLGLLMKYRGTRRRIYYTVGNHDLALEQRQDDMSPAEHQRSGPIKAVEQRQPGIAEDGRKQRQGDQQHDEGDEPGCAG